MNRNLMKTSILILFIICTVTLTKAQESVQKQNSLSGNLMIDSKIASNDIIQAQAPQLNFQSSSKKSRWLGGLMSLVLPGAGEFYAQSYLKAAIFFVVEAAAITTAIVYNNKGDKQTQYFQDYANQNWDVAKYAAWTLQHVNNINPNVNPNDYKVFRNNVNWQNLNSSTDWNQYNDDVDWTELNRLESALGSGYTHQLPYPGDQQFYELIGKYPQYSHGWDTSNLSDTDYHILTQQFLWYSHQRGLANTFYQTGSTAIAFVYINHFLSTLDAIWTVDRYNDSIAMNLRVNPQRVSDKIEFAPTLNLSYNF